MTRAEAINIIATALQEVDHTTLEAAAAHIAKVASPSGLTGRDFQAAFATDSTLPRALSPGELALIEQSRDDFRLGRSKTIDESMTHVAAELERRRLQRTAP